MAPIRRREFITRSAIAAGGLALGPAFLRQALAAPATAGESPYGPLLPANADNILLPSGFSSREVARGLQPVAGTAYPWHIFSDGQATFRTLDGGWILVSNSESLAVTGAGVSAIRFRPDGQIAAAYRVLAGTNVNCAGGPTPWGTWLSCEEHDGGLVWECDPSGVLPSAPRPAMGVFTHEAAAVDPVGKRVYLTEDRGDGGFYRFTPAAYPDLSSGLLEVAVVGPDDRVAWREVPDPTMVLSGTPTRSQVAEMTPFASGEGAWYAEGIVYFTTKGDKRVWAFDARESRIEILFDDDTAPGASLDAVDNVTVSVFGDVYVCEDGGNMEVGLITREREVSPFLRFVGPEHALSELAGVVFDPSGTRMYVASQGAYPLGLPHVDPLPTERGPGAVYEVTGPFRLPPAGVPAERTFGPPAGELRPRGPLASRSGRAPRRVWLRAPRRIARSRLARKGLTVRVEVLGPGSVALALHTSDLARSRGKGGSTSRPRLVTLARRRRRVKRGGRVRLRVRLGRRARRRLARRRGGLTATLTVVVRDTAGTRVATRRVGIGPVRGRRTS